MINYQRIWLKFSQLIKYLLFYIPYKICKHSLISIDFIASVYELFDNPSYVLLTEYLILFSILNKILISPLPNKHIGHMTSVI